MGTGNTAFGDATLYFNTTANSNTAFGYDALASSANTSGSRNTALGYQAGMVNANGSNNTFIGFSSGPGSGTLTNATAIGAKAMVNCPNCMVLGDSTAPTNVGIGTNAPSQAVEVVGSVKATSFLGNGAGLTNLSGENQLGVACHQTVGPEGSACPSSCPRLWRRGAGRIAAQQAGVYVGQPRAVAVNELPAFENVTTLL